jgi:membrane fusion protein (multidrug efflux system)
MSARIATRPLAALVLAAATAAALAGCGASAGKEAASRAPDVAVLAAGDLATVARADLASGVLVQGTLEPVLDVNLIAPYPEALEEVAVKEGQAVARGQVLARFRTESMAPAAAGTEAARRVAAADLARMQNLFREGAVSARDLDAAEARLRAAEAEAALAGKRLGEATVRAPFAGVVAKRFVQSGDRVGDGDPLFRVVNTDELELSASVPTETLAGVRPGAPVALTVSGLGGASIAGRLGTVT